ncbi:hypothetical protein GLOIN_2v1764763 [Rhizophagus clarus]|uniref:Uncharacterized protein n=1 Tax=Rhizophagus clarus TaxID=94130 RepID=A0A8H3L6E9_9GLOM|nr:hypothetical protein GLOIN_2v1764763 [Rhizophagus clarus]
MKSLTLTILLGEALEKKLAEFATNNPPQTARVLLNAEIKQQFSSNIIQGLGRDMIKRIKRLSSEKFTDDEIKIIQKRVRTVSSQSNGLENQLDDLDLNEQG